jgi:hypothetical protein
MGYTGDSFGFLTIGEDPVVPVDARTISRNKNSYQQTSHIYRIQVWQNKLSLIKGPLKYCLTILYEVKRRGKEWKPVLKMIYCQGIIIGWAGWCTEIFHRKFGWI